MTTIEKRINTNLFSGARSFNFQIVNYVNALPLHDKFKAQIVASDFIDEILPIYTKYPSLFAKAFSIDEHVYQLNIAGFLYHKSIICLDQLLDGQSKNSELMLLSSVCQEESIKILTTIFPPDSEFWRIWNQRRNEYLKAYHLDRSLAEIKSHEEFELLADHKAAFGKIPIDCLHILAGNNNDSLYTSLLASHKYFYCGVQILDDINDLREDLKNEQFNFALSELKNDLTKLGLAIDELDPVEVSKYFFICGTADRVFDTAFSYFNKSSESIDRYQNLEEWIYEIDKLKNITLTKALNVQAFKKMSLAELNLSNTKSEPETLEIAISSGLDFVLRMQSNDGFWNEYFNEAGTSDAWSTAFIVSSLSQNTGRDVKKAVDKGIKFLRESSNKDLWGFNKEWIPDADSSTFAQLAIFESTGKTNDQYLNAWLKFQNENGGFTTYNSDEHILASLGWSPGRNVTGWRSSHYCVSAAAYYFLCRTGNQSIQLERLESFLKEKLAQNILPESYWWTSPLYSLSYLVLSLPYCKDAELRSLILKSACAGMSLQNNNGSLGHDSSFYTSLIVNSFSEVSTLFELYKKHLAKAVYWLLLQQMTDGSWLSANDMRIPSPDTINPNSETEWPVATKGLNIRVYEFNRVFTTVASFSALNKYQKISRANG